MDKYGLAIYNENRVKKRLSTYLDCGGLASVIFPTMKTLDPKKAENKAEKAAVNDLAFTVTFRTGLRLGSRFCTRSMTFLTGFL